MDILGSPKKMANKKQNDAEEEVDENVDHIDDLEAGDYQNDQY